MSGRHHQRTGWTYSRRPRGTCTGCNIGRSLDTHGLVVAHRARRDGRVTAGRCPGSTQPPKEAAMTEPPTEPPPATRMAHFVEAAQRFAGTMAELRQAMTGALRAFNHLYAVMQHTGLLDEPSLCDGCDRTGQPVTATDDGRALLCADCHANLRNPRYMAAAQQPEHAPALSQLATWHHVDCDKNCGGTCTQERPTSPPQAPGSWLPDTPDQTPGPDPVDSCPTCWPRPCDPSRSLCKRYTYIHQRPTVRTQHDLYSPVHDTANPHEHDSRCAHYGCPPAATPAACATPDCTGEEGCPNNTPGHRNPPQAT